jgi:hypothetical protein
MASSSFTAINEDVQLTVGRATTSGASAANSTNITSNVSSLALPTSSYYMAAWPGMTDSNGVAVNINGFALDIPGEGTFYYTIWMSSSASNNYSDIAAVLTVLHV